MTESSLRTDGGCRPPRRGDSRPRPSGLVQLGRLSARQLRRGDRAAAVQARRHRPRDLPDVPDRSPYEHGRLAPRRLGDELHRHVDVRRWPLRGDGPRPLCDARPHHPFPGARQARRAARRPCRAGQADPRPCLPAGRRPPGRRALLQLQRHAEAHPRAQRAAHDRPGSRGLRRAGRRQRAEARPGPAARRRCARPAGRRDCRKRIPRPAAPP